VDHRQPGANASHVFRLQRHPIVSEFGPHLSNTRSTCEQLDERRSSIQAGWLVLIHSHLVRERRQNSAFIERRRWCAISRFISSRREPRTNAAGYSTTSTTSPSNTRCTLASLRAAITAREPVLAVYRQRIPAAHARAFCCEWLCGCPCKTARINEDARVYCLCKMPSEQGQVQQQRQQHRMCGVSG
jgi:hypothetical protein